MDSPDEYPGHPPNGTGAVQLSHYKLSAAFTLSLNAAKSCGYKFEEFDEDVTAFDSPRYILPVSVPSTGLDQWPIAEAIEDYSSIQGLSAPAPSAPADTSCSYLDLDDLTSDLSSLASSMSLGSDSNESIPGASFLSRRGSLSDSEDADCGKQGGWTSESDVGLMEEMSEDRGPFLAWRYVCSQYAAFTARVASERVPADRTLKLPKPMARSQRPSPAPLPIKKHKPQANVNRKKGKSNRRKLSKRELEMRLKRAEEKKLQKRGGRRLRVEAKGDKVLAKEIGLRARNHARSDAYANDGVSLLKHGAAAGTGWQGKTMPQDELRSLQEVWDSGDMSKVICNFEHILYRG